uniref:Uncharacterized protein n=1 Tax=Arundo donax TaxID=35708 RepID=A0A0A9CB84_ARUDO
MVMQLISGYTYTYGS